MIVAATVNDHGNELNWVAFYEATLTQYIMYFTVWQSIRGGVKPQNVPGAQSRHLSYDQDHKDFCICGRNVEATYPFLLFLSFSESAAASFCLSSLQKPEEAQTLIPSFPNTWEACSVSQPQRTLPHRR